MKLHKPDTHASKVVAAQPVDKLAADLPVVDLATAATLPHTDTPTDAALAQPATLLEAIPAPVDISFSNVTIRQLDVIGGDPVVALAKAETKPKSHVRKDFSGLTGLGYLNPSNWSLVPVDNEQLEFRHVNGTVVHSTIADFNAFMK